VLAGLAGHASGAQPSSTGKVTVQIVYDDACEHSSAPIRYSTVLIPGNHGAAAISSYSGTSLTLTNADGTTSPLDLLSLAYNDGP